jgi:hypothetical protein
VVKLGAYLQANCVFDTSFRLCKQEIRQRFRFIDDEKCDDKEVHRASILSSVLLYLGFPETEGNYVGLQWRNSMSLEDVVSLFHKEHLIEDRTMKVSQTEVRACFKAFVQNKQFILHYSAPEVTKVLEDLYGYHTCGDGIKKNKPTYFGIGLKGVS